MVLNLAFVTKYGQTYTALSRKWTKNNVYLLNPSNHCNFHVYTCVAEEMSKLHSHAMVESTTYFTWNNLDSKINSL